ncbi:unnamed protein product [Amoebophrya sp. A120]|nr:unnamed protein product [Amoebophrya sp. A120]|eukprot:GSA120T00024421001.1
MLCSSCETEKPVRDFPDLDVLLGPEDLQECLQCRLDASTMVMKTEERRMDTFLFSATPSCDRAKELQAALVQRKCRALLEVISEQKKEMDLQRRAGRGSADPAANCMALFEEPGEVLITDILGKSYQLPVSGSHSLRDVRKKIETKFQVPERNQKLLLNGEDVLQRKVGNSQDSSSNVSPAAAAKFWRDVRVPPGSHLRLVWRMFEGGVGEGGVSDTTRLRFDLKWKHPSDAMPYARHLNGICVAIGRTRKGKKLHHVDFRGKDEVSGIYHAGCSQPTGKRCEKKQTIEIYLDEVPDAIHGMYFFLATGADIDGFSHLEVELRDVTSNVVLDRAPSRAQSSGWERAVLLCCARRNESAVGWDVDAIGQDVSGSVSHTRQRFQEIDALVQKLERAFHL